MNEDWDVKPSDKSINVRPTILTSSVFVLLIPNGMWGSAMFGSPQILGAGYSSSYTNDGLYIRTNYKDLNVLER